ncbi:NAD(+) diphosphatase [Jannaschia aquimarina]|uniref:NAD(+) diphosphatase n=1 Tax=Jannaschia aquimarina TaxID=935700 RepID=A0A0D1EL82_9RHOB|nr:NAD(+) diphosphatase [Jannaschia aquimarina]KIT17731.1 NADH pyrophosphatase [Jannaschia aquimarina]SNS77938.1 NAD+ diphosphatase [Jannaschia aquimarina]
MHDDQRVTFGGGGLDRAEDYRRHPDQLAKLPARTLPLWRGKPLMNEEGDALVLLDGHAYPDHGHPILIGKVDGHAVFARDVSAMAVRGDTDGLGAFLDPTVQRLPDRPGAFHELRATMTRLDALDAEIAASAKGVVEWHRTHGHCPFCGTKTEPGKAGWMRACPGCGRQHFPRTDPVVIMLVTRGNDCLLGRSPHWPEGFYSCLAGFMEPGETMEAAVRRETWEETGIRVGRVEYVASQPWAFPYSLMLGAHGHAEPGEIAIDPEEIADARWVSREELLRVMAGEHPELTPARPGAIARFLLDEWLAGRLI